MDRILAGIDSNSRHCRKRAASNVQPHSGTSANQIVIGSLLSPGARIMGLGLNSGGHLSHGSPVSLIGQWFEAIEYHVGEDNWLDYDEVRRLALQTRPDLIVAGASAYPRSIDFARFRAIADEVGAYLLADISHISGLVVAGEHQSPIDHTHFTTTSTYKQLYGPRGGLILMGKDHEQLSSDGRTTLSQRLQKATFPFFQSTPSLNTIAAKARALGMVATPSFKLLARRVVEDAQALACELKARGYDVLTGGTDNHMVLLNIASSGLTGTVAERALEECGIVVNKNRIPGDTRSALVTSGLRLGSNGVAARGMYIEEMGICAELIDRVLSSVQQTDERHYTLDEHVKADVSACVHELCAQFTISGYAG
ncbi:serine hydroxymethyltransferase [Dictyobacter halimunensis]|uniref:serine hydroxymethyltransferase n=1 Tax=Dictyobacter halimunensis TaxID=3026934 RepID=UPI0030C6DC5C